MALLHGKFIRPRAFAEQDSYVRSPSNLVSDEGLSGALGMTHTMSLNSEAMFLSARDVEDGFYIGFDFGSVIRLGYMCVWNFNQADGYGSSIKNADILYSIDGKKYKLFKSVTFAPASGKDKLRATNLNDGKNSPLDFEGLSTRFIKIVPCIESKEGCWGKYVEGQTRYGLSKVRFFLYRQEPKKGGYVYAEAFEPKHNVLTAANGLEGDCLGIEQRDMFLTDAYPRNMDLIFDLNMTTFIKGFDYINYNVPYFLDAGIKEVDVYVSIDANSYQKVGSYSLSKASGKQGEPFRSVLFDKPYYTRFIKFSVAGGPEKGTFGYCNGFEYRYGLGKLRFCVADEGYYTEPARDYSSLLSNFNGWNGADGLFSVSMDGNDSKRKGKERQKVRSMFLFSDSFLGEVNPLTGARRLAYMVNNTMAYLDGVDPESLTINFEYGKDGKLTYDNILKEEAKGFHYWMQDCVVLGKKFYVFTDNVLSLADDLSLPEGFRFKLIGVDMLEFDIVDGKLDYNSQIVHKTPLFLNGKKSLMFGCGIFANTSEAGMPCPDGYVYVYGNIDVAIGKRNLLCARVKPEHFTNFDMYEYFDGKGFSKDILSSAPIADDVSAEMSVMPIDFGKDKGKYLYTYLPGSVGPTVCTCVGDTPYGPFVQPKTLYNISVVENLDYTNIKKVYCYNAKAHYHLAQLDEVLISYNVNCMDYESHFINGHIYAPRFLRYKEF